MDDEVVDNCEQTAEQLAEAMMATQLSGPPPGSQPRTPLPGGGGAAGNDFRRHRRVEGRTPQERKRTPRGFNFDCDEDGPGLASCKRPGAGLAPPGRGAGARREPAGTWSAAATDAQDVQPAAGGCGDRVAVGGLRRGGLRGERRSGAGGPGAGKPHGPGAWVLCSTPRVSAAEAPAVPVRQQ